MAWTYQILIEKASQDNSGNLAVPVIYKRDGVVVKFPGYGEERMHSVGSLELLKGQIRTILQQGEARDALAAEVAGVLTDGVFADLDPSPKSEAQIKAEAFNALVIAKNQFELKLISAEDYDAAVAAYKQAADAKAIDAK